MSALFGKCLSFRDFVLLTSPVPINDPVCILKSAGQLSGKREWAAGSLLDTHTLPGAILPSYSLELTSHLRDEEVTQVSGKLGPDAFVILWMIQLGTWREKLWERSFLASWVMPSTCWGDIWEAISEGYLRVRTIAQGGVQARTAGRGGPALGSRERRVGAATPSGFGLWSSLVPAAWASQRWRPFGPDLLRTGLHNRKPALVCFVFLSL